MYHQEYRLALGQSPKHNNLNQNRNLFFSRSQSRDRKMIPGWHCFLRSSRYLFYTSLLLHQLPGYNFHPHSPNLLTSTSSIFQLPRREKEEMKDRALHFMDVIWKIHISLHSSSVGQNLVMWPHLDVRAPIKCGLQLERESKILDIGCQLTVFVTDVTTYVLGMTLSNNLFFLTSTSELRHPNECQGIIYFCQEW